MRILSQDGIGTIDLPYEQVGISIHFQNRKEIIAYPAGIYTPDDDYWTMARYSTEDKAKRAMEMLHEYNKLIRFEGVSTTIIDDKFYEMLKKYFLITLEEHKTNNPTITLIKKTNYFQFPADDELEGV